MCKKLYYKVISLNKDISEEKINKFISIFILIIAFTITKYNWSKYNNISGRYYNEINNKALLNDTLESLKSKFLKEKKRVNALYTFQADLRLAYGLSYLDNSMLLFGVGGKPSFRDEANKLLGYPSVIEQIVFIENIDKLNRELDFYNRTTPNIFSYVQKTTNKLASMPSIWPVKGRRTSEYGGRTHPITGEHLFHSGLDIANKEWTTIIAPADGVVVSTRTRNGYGLTIELKHDLSGFNTLYAHLIDYACKPGDLVLRGDIIGYLGNTGRSTGPHLHYELRKEWTTYNPTDFLTPEDQIYD